MKWFKHESDAHTNLKLQRVLDQVGVEAYGYYWICVELIAIQGENFRLKSEKNWKNYIQKMTGLLVERQEKYLPVFVQEGLIDKKANKHGDLYIPKLAERSDDYTNRMRRKYGQGSDPIEEKRVDKIRTDKKDPEPILKTLRETWGKKK